ncbi:MAG TPA: hypothetical protein RMH99_20720 [Sandaracinaceae bacterium LLY-WYZ-13_1]|nr:hypothetical protein [Sandaracinaceae bacterium LLY-WYZ-13_1]
MDTLWTIATAMLGLGLLGCAEPSAGPGDRTGAPAAVEDPQGPSSASGAGGAPEAFASGAGATSGDREGDDEAEPGAARARATRIAEAWVRAHGYTEAPTTIEASELRRELTDVGDLETVLAARAGTLEARAVCARGWQGRFTVAFAYRAARSAGRGRAVRVEGGAVDEIAHQDLRLDVFCGPVADR